MDRSSPSQAQRWYEGKNDQQSSVRVAPSAVNVISITRRPEGGIVNVEVRRQEGSGVEQSGSFGSRESSPRNVVFAKTPPLPLESRFRGFGGIALHSSDTGRLHRALADHVRALHGQSLFDRFNEPAPPVIDSHVSHVSSSVSSGRRVHTIPIRIEGRNRPASSPPATTQHQRVYEIPVNVLSLSSKEKSSSAPTVATSEQPSKFDAVPSPQTIQPFPRLQSHFDPSNAAERKLASLMSQLETDMNSSASLPVKKQLSEISVTPVAVSTAKSPPPYHGPHITEFFGRPTLPHVREGVIAAAKPSAGFVPIVDAASPSPVQSPSSSEPPTPVRTIAVNSEPQLLPAAESVESFGHCEKCAIDIVNLSEACQAMGFLYHTSCFLCSVCQRTLRGKAFYEVQGNIYCEDDYLRTGYQQLAVKCDACDHLVLDVVVQALGKSYHRACFCCSCCSQCLADVPFTVDADKRLLCLPDYYRLHAAKCCLCGKFIVPAEGSEDAVRVVMMDNDYCVSCFRCKDCGRQLSDRTDELCYPLLRVLLCLACHQRRLADSSQMTQPVMA